MKMKGVNEELYRGFNFFKYSSTHFALSLAFLESIYELFIYYINNSNVANYVCFRNIFYRKISNRKDQAQEDLQYIGRIKRKTINIFYFKLNKKSVRFLSVVSMIFLKNNT